MARSGGRRTAPAPSLSALAAEVAACERCPRLVAWRTEVASRKVRRHAGKTYWGRPVPGFGDPAARLLLVGLAPGAHGSNRTGRMFTGDASGDFLFPALHRAGFASQPRALHRADGLRLDGAWITAAVRCAPPGNRPLPTEAAACAGHLEREWDLLPGVRVVLCLGRFAHDAVIRLLRGRGCLERAREAPFAHAAEHAIPGGPVVLDSYHVSQQVTRTGRLTAAMFDGVLRRARALAGLGPWPGALAP